MFHIIHVQMNRIKFSIFFSLLYLSLFFMLYACFFLTTCFFIPSSFVVPFLTFYFFLSCSPSHSTFSFRCIMSPVFYCFFLCCVSVFGRGSYRESWKLLQPLTQFQRLQHRPWHQRSYHYAAVWGVIWTQEWRPYHPVSLGWHKSWCWASYSYVHPHWPGGEDGGARDLWPQWWVYEKGFMPHLIEKGK